LALARERPYAAITSHDYAPFVHALAAHAIWKRTRIPVLSELHHVAGYPRAANARERFDVWASRHYVRWAQKWVAGFRVVNAIEMPALLERWGVERELVHVLPSLYLDLETFRSRAGSVVDADVTWCGRTVTNKGVLDLLAAFRQLVAEGRGAARLRLIGRGALDAEIDAFIARHGLTQQVERIAWVEQPSELAELYRQSRVVVCASYSEGGPRFTAEAMACGTPVISTRVGIMPDLIREGETGHLYDGSVEGLTRTLARVLDDEPHRAKLARNLLEQRPCTRYERTRVIAELAAGIQRIASASRVR
jgi:glycosyltransferase involved in cell wall biosynthesis